MYFAKGLLMCALLFAAMALHADDFGERFAFVAIDEQTEERFGSMPLDRRIIAKAVDACRAAEAKGVVLKFFYDQPKDAEGDAALADAISKLPVAIQARISEEDGTETEIPSRFSIGRRVPVEIQGARGWIPFPALLSSAAQVGFVDYRTPKEVPMVVGYRDRYYKSLVLICLEMAYDSAAKFEEGGLIYIGPKHLAASSQYSLGVKLSETNSIQPISLLDLLSGKSGQDLRGRVVVIGYDTPKAPTITIFTKSYGIHRYFIECLASAQRDLVATR